MPSLIAAACQPPSVQRRSKTKIVRLVGTVSVSVPDLSKTFSSACSKSTLTTALFRVPDVGRLRAEESDFSALVTGTGGLVPVELRDERRRSGRSAKPAHR